MVGMSWSADEALLAFVADAPAPEQKAAFDGQFRFREELGEKYVPRRAAFPAGSVERASMASRRLASCAAMPPVIHIDAIARRSASPHLAYTSSICSRTPSTLSSHRRMVFTRGSRPSRLSGRASSRPLCGRRIIFSHQGLGEMY